MRNSFGLLVLAILVIAVPRSRAQDDRTPEGRPYAITPNARQRTAMNSRFATIEQKMRTARRSIESRKSQILSDARRHQREYASSIARWDRAYAETIRWHESQVSSLRKRLQSVVKDSEDLDNMAREIQQKKQELLENGALDD